MPPARTRLSASFTTGDTLTVNGTTISFVASGATGTRSSMSPTASSIVGNLLSEHRLRSPAPRLPSTISGGVDHAQTASAAGYRSRLASSTALAPSRHSVSRRPRALRPRPRASTPYQRSGTAAARLELAPVSGAAQSPDDDTAGDRQRDRAVGHRDLGFAHHRLSRRATPSPSTARRSLFHNSTATLADRSNAAGNALNPTYLELATANVGNLLSAVDSITGTSTPSTDQRRRGHAQYADSAASLTYHEFARPELAARTCLARFRPAPSPRSSRRCGSRARERHW